MIEEFLRLESSGWKVDAGTALACTHEEASFFREVIRAAFDRGQLTFLTLRLDDRIIAAHCMFLDPPGTFHFKTAYDEAFRRYSPGTLLQIEETRRMHAPEDHFRANVVWSDSCAGPDDGPDYRCWPDRRPIARFRITKSWAPHAPSLMLWPVVQKVLQPLFRPYGLKSARSRRAGQQHAS